MFLDCALKTEFLHFRKLLSSSQHLHLDSEDSDDAFVPAKKDVQSSSEDEDEDEEVGSEDELVVKRRSRTAGSRTPRSTQKARTPARTPSKTPSKKVKLPSGFFCPSACRDWWGQCEELRNMAKCDVNFIAFTGSSQYSTDAPSCNS